MFSKQYVFGVWAAIQIIGCNLLISEAAWGQVIPDGTTPTPDPGLCLPNCTVGGGTTDQTNTNLFHSFEQLSVPTGGIVIFEHSPTIRNIFARVTGTSSSTIDGLIRTSSTSNDASLFLINPNGISFGPRGGLDIGGSFVATTADAIQFGDQGTFSATDTNSDPALLTVSPSAFLLTQGAQPIVNQSIAPNPALPFLIDGLRVQEGKSLILLGGNVILERAPNSLNIDLPVRAPGGRIELGGVRGSSVVGLDIDGDSLSLNYADNALLADIVIKDADLDVSGLSDNRAGNITISSNSLSFDGSALLSNTFGSENSGNTFIRADDSVTLENGTSISSTSFGSGAGGNIEIITGDISLTNATLSVTTRGMGNAGRLFLDAEAIFLDMDSNLVSDADSFTDAVGRVGEIQIRTTTLSLNNESTVSILTSGEALDIESSRTLNIEAQGSISLFGESAITSETLGQANASNIEIITPVLVVNDSIISAAVNEEGRPDSDATGRGGIVDIRTQSLSLENNAQLTSSTSGAGDAGAILVEDAALVSLSNSLISTETSAAGAGGDIAIGTEQLTADAGAQISATATATASASTRSGNVTVDAARINLSGEATGLLAETQGEAAAGFIALGTQDSGETLAINFQAGADISAATSGSGDGGQIRVIAPEAVTFRGDGSLSTRSTGPGPAGDVSIQTNGQFRVQDSASVEVSGESTGDSGTLAVIAGTAVLNDGRLLASTQAGEGGNISLQIDDALVLREDSLVSAEAFNDADGGNVDISTPFIIALFPRTGSDGNDIQASAVDGNGGRITIQANTLFNIEENIALAGNMTNDLDASSGTGIDGEVIIETLEVDPDEGTVRLPSGLADPEISQGCQAGGDVNGQFVNAGRGGLPSNPYEPLSGDGIQEDIFPAGQTTTQQTALESSPETIVEAQGWSENAQGDIVLVTDNPTYHGACQRTFTGAS
ncbi:MAG: filamentous hemagglutinin N-terminal domain-containing protein [Cyanobacteria bacterium P01_B01_bin.77]